MQSLWWFEILYPAYSQMLIYVAENLYLVHGIQSNVTEQKILIFFKWKFWGKVLPTPRFLDLHGYGLFSTFFPHVNA